MAGLKTNRNINITIILNVLGTISYQAINFLLTPILTRALGVYDFGVVTLYNSWVHILLPIVSLNLESVVGLIVVHIDEKDHNRYTASLMGLALISFSAVSLLFAIFWKPLVAFLEFEPIVVILLMVQCFGMMLVNFIIAYYIHHQQTIRQFSFSIGISISTCLLTLLLLKIIPNENLKYLCRVIGYAVPYILAGIIVIFILLKKSRQWFCLDVWKFALPICIPFIFHTLSHLVLSQSGKIVLQNSVENGVESAGFYGFAFTIASIMQVIWTALNNAWTPFYFRMLADNQNDNIKKSTRRYMLLYTACFCAFALIVPEFTRIMGGEKYAGAEKLALIMLIGIYLVFMYSFAVNYKTYKKKTISIAIGTITAACVNFLLCVLLAPKYSYWGCAIAMVIAYLVLFLMHQFTVRDKTGQYNLGFGFFALGAAFAVAGCAATILLSEMMILRWATAFSIGIIMLFKMIKQKSIF